MTRRLVLSFAAALVALLTMAGSASAQQYPPQEGTLAANRTQAAPGEPITISGTGCPNTRVTVSFDNQVVGTTQGNAAGNFSFTFNVPSNASPGRHTITATCVLGNGQTRRMTTQITVVAAAAAARPPRAGTLPRTGESPIPMALGGASLVALGAMAVIATRRRRSPVA